MIEAVILFILTKYDATIYRVSKIIDETFFAYLKTSLGTINPAFKRLEKMELVTCLEKMSEGGMLSKTYSINKEGLEYLKNYLLNFRCQNPYHILNEAKIALWMSEILKSDIEKEEFKNNMLNNLELYKIKLEKGLESDYTNLSPKQEKIAKMALDETNRLIELM